MESFLYFCKFITAYIMHTDNGRHAETNLSS